MPTTTTALTLAEWNPCSLDAKKPECACVLQEIDPDVLCVPESWLKPGKRIEFEGVVRCFGTTELGLAWWAGDDR